MIAEAPTKKESPNGANKGWWKNAPTSTVRRYYKEDLKRKAENEDITIAEGTTIHRMVPKTWEEREKKLTGRAYASYTKDDVERYRNISRLFGANNYVDMQFKARDVLVSPSAKKRVDEMIKLIDSDPKVRESVMKSTRNIFLFVPKKYFNDLEDPKKAERVYRRASYLLATNKDIRDPYFDRLKEQGYNMVLDDADIKGGISKSPIIVFDREKSLEFDKSQTIE